MKPVKMLVILLVVIMLYGCEQPSAPDPGISFFPG